MKPTDPARGVYSISVAADLTGMGVQTLRLYEARGLLDPDRTPGGTRRYSPDDIDRLHRIGDLLDAGLNLAGIAMVLDLQDRNTRLRAHHPQEDPSMTTPGRAQTDPTVDPLNETPEADRLDQHTPASDDDTPPTRDQIDQVDEADLLDQHIPIPDAEDDYPYQTDEP